MTIFPLAGHGDDTAKAAAATQPGASAADCGGGEIVDSSRFSSAADAIMVNLQDPAPLATHPPPPPPSEQSSLSTVTLGAEL